MATDMWKIAVDPCLRRRDWVPHDQTATKHLCWHIIQYNCSFLKQCILLTQDENGLQGP